MPTTNRQAGTAGSYLYTLDRAPDSPPVRTIYSDADRTVEASPPTATLVTTSPTSFLATIPVLPAGRYYLRHAFTLGGIAYTDSNDELILETPDGTVDASLVTVSRYRALTGDTVTPDGTVTERLAHAQSKVEEYLRRPLNLAERTERVRLLQHRGHSLFGTGWAAYPKATPISSALGLIVEGAAVVGVTASWLSFYDQDEQYANVTYTGGWTATTLPVTLAETIARLAATGGQPASAPAGATSVRNGDVAVTYGRGGAGVQIDSSAMTALKPYIRRRK